MLHWFKIQQHESKCKMNNKLKHTGYLLVKCCLMQGNHCGTIQRHKTLNFTFLLSKSIVGKAMGWQSVILPHLLACLQEVDVPGSYIIHLLLLLHCLIIQSPSTTVKNLYSLIEITLTY